MRDSCIFYRSFYESINELPDTNKLEIYNAIFSYSLNFIEPELTGLSKSIFTLIKPQLDANIKRFNNGLQPKDKQTKSKTEAKDKQKESKVEANNNVNNNNNLNNKENEITLQLVIDYFSSNGYSEDSAIKFYNYYDSSNWVDTNGKKVKSWKQKAIGVWFKPENLKKQDNKKVSYVSTEDNQW